MTAKEISNRFEAFFKEDDWKYETINLEDGNRAFTGAIGGLDGAYSSVKFFVFPKDGSVQAIAMVPASAKNVLPAMAEFLHRANYGLNFGKFELDFSDGEIRFQMSYPEEAFAGPNASERFKTFLYGPACMINKYSKGIAAVLLGLATPEQAVKMCEG